MKKHSYNCFSSRIGYSIWNKPRKVVIHGNLGGVCVELGLWNHIISIPHSITSLRDVILINDVAHFNCSACYLDFLEICHFTVY